MVKMDMNGGYDSRAAAQKATSVPVKAGNVVPKRKVGAGARTAARIMRATSPAKKKPSGIAKGKARLVDNDNPTNPQSQGYGGEGIQDTIKND